MTTPPNITARRHSQLVWWVIAVSLAAIAVNTTFRGDSSAQSAFAQGTRSAGARGIFAFSGEIGPNTPGVYMVDVDAGTIWCYELVSTKGIKQLRLVSARSWIFDRYLRQYSVDGLTPSDVEEMVTEQRSRTNP